MTPDTPALLGSARDTLERQRRRGGKEEGETDASFAHVNPTAVAQ
jgi:hypothetical protein